MKSDGSEGGSISPIRDAVKKMEFFGEAIPLEKCCFFNIVQTHVKKLCCKFGVFWGSFNYMKFA